MAGPLPDFMVKKPVVVPQEAGQPQNPAKPTPGWMTTEEGPAEEAAKRPGPTISAAEDIANVAPSALRTGMELVPAGPAETSELVPMIVRGVLSKLNEMGLVVGGDQTLQEFDQSYQHVMHPAPGISMDPRDDFGLQSVRENITNPILGEAHPREAQTGTGQLVKTGLEIGPSVLAGPGTTLQKLGMIGGGTLGSEGAGWLAEQAGASPGWVDASKIAGGLLGGLAPQAWNRLSNPRPIPPSRQPLIDTLRAKNVPISAGQLSGNERLRIKEDMAGGTSAHEQQPAAFTGAAADIQGGFAGKGPRGLTREQMRAELDRMGAEFDRIEGAAQPVTLGNKHHSDLVDVVDDYKQSTGLPAPVVENVVDEIRTSLSNSGGFLTGEVSQNTRSKLSKLIRESDDPGVQNALSKVQDILDDAMSAGLSPEDQRAWRKVRAQYRNFLPIENARAAAGAEEGFISPAQLKQGIKTTQGKREITSGEGELTDLAEAGAGVLKPVQSSKTAERARAMLSGLMSTIAGGGAAGLASHLGFPPEVMAMAGAGAAGAAHLFPLARDAAIVSDIGQKIMSRQGPRIPTDRSGLAEMLMLARMAQLQQMAGEDGQPQGMGPH